MTKDLSSRRALISIADKTGIISLAKKLSACGFEIISTGGTAHLLLDNHVPVLEISRYTDFPEIMSGRVKTLHPKIFGGILARGADDKDVMEELKIPPIEIVIVNLYPFAETIANPQHTFNDAIENIDIGGVSLIRAAAKNHTHVAVVVDSADYPLFINELSSTQTISPETRFKLAKKAFAYTAAYDAIIANYLNSMNDTDHLFPEKLTLQFDKKQNLRYGENPHQQAALYLEKNPPAGTIASSRQLQGKALSFNNLVDADTALECVKEFADKPTVCIVKHANPCGVAIGVNVLDAYKRAYITDPTSAFGGIIACNQKMERDTAENILQQQFVEVIVAPEFSEEAREVFNSKPNVRLLAYSQQNNNQDLYNKRNDVTCKVSYDIKRIQGGILIQDFDQDPPFLDLNIVTQRAPSPEEIKDLLFAWKVAKYVKSNAIVFAKNEMTIGIGAGQMSRVISTRIAEIKARDEHLEIKNSVMASDAFFPFRDSIDAAATLNITAIIQPGGSIRDSEIIAAADEANIAMVFTGTRHFRH